MHWYVDTNYFAASINQRSFRLQYPFADTSSIKKEYTWTPKRSRSFEVNLRRPPSMKIYNLSDCVNFTSSLSKDFRL